jgi:hypothetical protein
MEQAGNDADETSEDDANEDEEDEELGWEGSGTPVETKVVRGTRTDTGTGIGQVGGKDDETGKDDEEDDTDDEGNDWAEQTDVTGREEEEEEDEAAEEAIRGTEDEEDG